MTALFWAFVVFTLAACFLVLTAPSPFSGRHVLLIVCAAVTVLLAPDTVTEK